MILDRIRHIVTGNSFYGIEVNFSDQKKRYYVTEVVKSKNSVAIVGAFETTDFEKIQQELSVDKPVIISFSGLGIINKRENVGVNYKSKIIFNSNPEDFYWNEFYTNDYLFVSVSRKVTIDEELALWAAKEFYVVKAYLGPFVTVNTQKLLEVECLETSICNLYFEEGKLNSFKAAEGQSRKVYTLNDQDISNFHVIGFSSVIDYLFPNNEISNTINVVENNRSEFVYKKVFSFAGISFVILLFCLLLGSFFLLGSYQTKITDVTFELANKKEAYNKVLKLKKDKSNKEAILKRSGIHNNRFLSYYAWQLTDVIPKEIQLINMHIFPKSKQSEKDEPILFKTNQIDVSGYVKVNKSLSKWIKEIKKYDWIDSVEIIDFERDNGSNGFTLKIIIKDNV